MAETFITCWKIINTLVYISHFAITEIIFHWLWPHIFITGEKPSELNNKWTILIAGNGDNLESICYSGESRHGMVNTTQQPPQTGWHLPTYSWEKKKWKTPECWHVEPNLIQSTNVSFEIKKRTKTFIKPPELILKLFVKLHKRNNWNGKKVNWTLTSIQLLRFDEFIQFFRSECDPSISLINCEVLFWLPLSQR